MVPDLEYAAREYVSSDEPESANLFLQRTLLGHQRRPRGIEGLLRSAFGNAHHLWMWDYNTIAKELEHVGFYQIRRADFNDSVDLMFRDVEDFGRWKMHLGVECIK